jgi:hypothetical protein
MKKYNHNLLGKVLLTSLTALGLFSCGNVPSSSVVERPSNDVTTSSDHGASSSLTTSNDSEEVKVINIAEAIEIASKLADGEVTSERYLIYGVVSSITKPQYGQMVITDDTGKSIDVYGSYGKDGTTRYEDMEDKPVRGDTVLLSCTLHTYNGTAEIKVAWIMEVTHADVSDLVDLSKYEEKTIQEARSASDGTLVRVKGIVERIHYATGLVPCGFYLIDGTNSIYVYDKEVAGSVSVGNQVTIVGEKTCFVQSSEESYAKQNGYEGSIQISNAYLVENDGLEHAWDKSWVKESTIKEIMETPVTTTNITNTIYKVNGLVKKSQGSGFVNYYIDDIDGVTGTYVYTMCNGSDLDYLELFDGKICTIYLSVINAKSSATGELYRFIPIEVIDENYTFDMSQVANYALTYHAGEQFDEAYFVDPNLEVITSVSNDLIGVEDVKITYTSSDEEVLYFALEDDKLVLHTGSKTGNADITITATKDDISASKVVNVKNVALGNIAYSNVKSAIDASDEEEITIRGVIASGITNQVGVVIVDETGAIDAFIASDTDFQTLKVGDEVILKGTKSHKKKDSSTNLGNTCLANCEVVVNLHGDKAYDATSIINTTFKSIYEIASYGVNNDVYAQIYHATVHIEFYGTAYYSNVKIYDESDANSYLNLYCSSASSQYAFLNDYDGQNVEVDLMITNMNSKTNNTAIVIAVYENGVRVAINNGKLA